MAKFYPSRRGEYHLNPQNSLEIIAAISNYGIDAIGRAMRDNPEGKIPLIQFDGAGRVRMGIKAEAMNVDGSNYFELADLLVRGGDLTLLIYEHTKVTIPSDELHAIGARYSISPPPRMPESIRS